ncbi:MAG: DUF4430 domain-containing protein [Patescibacteria group bacterium]
MNKKRILISVILATLVALFVFYSGNNNSLPKENLKLNNFVQNEENVSSKKENSNKGISVVKELPQKAENTEEAVLLVGGKPLPISVSENKNLYDEMLTLQNENTLQFKSKYFNGIGYFIEEIGGIKNENGYYWSLYVNGKESELGASTLIPKIGDLIEWRYEKR